MRLGDRDHAAAMMPVRDMAGEQDQERGGNELREADKAEIER